MINSTHYSSPIGEILLASKDNKLIGAWFEGQKYYMANINDKLVEKEDKTLINTKNWLDRYFIGEKPSIDEVDLAPEGTDFRCEVWKILCEIPYGKTITYKDIASMIAQKRGIEIMSAQAVGGAVGHNPISIIIPCHRVLGSDGSLTGYAGGLNRKIFLLRHENCEF
ncbi:MAG: methylated-DNA--[Methanobrevibacter sp.]|uniref:methylated-DNA--[protein]-cysteine S-methyltransferase n=1 Tax=Methanobrevibacter sp. TaxID=66852 RepID=UPI0025DB6569|nr:methylated-DNA--[protein]-cysteine S-methyltransferase [Methanobrevibacter sp.]MBR0272023.1 methylated-DNA--[protein]-cysteine S-methyltransferase [Methanobrevibacter sp.]